MNLAVFGPLSLVLGAHGARAILDAYRAAALETWTEKAWQAAAGLVLAGLFLCLAATSRPVEPGFRIAWTSVESALMR